MKAISILLLIGTIVVTAVSAKDLTRAQALKIGSDNDGVKNGKFWLEKGDASPPFNHVGHIIISGGNQISLTLNGTNIAGHIMHAPYDDGSQTRLDFFVSSNGKGWVVAHVLKPEIKDTRPEKPRDVRPAKHKALASAAKLAIEEGDLDFLKLLFKKGLKVNEALEFKDGDTLLHEATSWKRLDVVKFLLESGADPRIRNRYGKRPIDAVITGESKKDKDLCALLARPNDKDTMVEGIPSGLIAELLPHQSKKEIIFVSWNGADPSPEMLAEIRKTVPNARAASRMVTLERRPLGAHTWYQDKKSKEFGSLIEVSVKHAGEVWTASVRSTVAPALAGGGWAGKARKKYGYWFTVSYMT